MFLLVRSPLGVGSFPFLSSRMLSIYSFCVYTVAVLKRASYTCDVYDSAHIDQDDSDVEHDDSDVEHHSTDDDDDDQSYGARRKHEV